MAQSVSLEFNYIQAGQENSFGWNAMKDGLTMQMPIIRSMTDKGLFRVETLAESGRWFKKHYSLTPATAVTVPDDHFQDGRSAVWYNSRFYRTGLLWKDDSFVIRDIHLFDERMESDYLRKAGTTNYCEYITPALVDGFVWSTPAEHAGLRMMAVQDDGSTTPIPVTSHTCRKGGKGTLAVTCETPYGSFKMLMKEKVLSITYEPASIKWTLEFTAAKEAKLPFTRIDAQAISATHNGFDYTIRLRQGIFSATASDCSRWRILPQKNRIVFGF